ncbi:MAG TPA: hypothetical protein VGU66_04095 [Candidatus Elarobacter sp.]|nr:hypothetical protein [Candidatus Elarobacter sp.]
MPARTAALTFALILAATLTAAATCPATNGRDDSSCDVAHPTTSTSASCAAAAHATETCADQATGLVRAIYLTRAASEWRKAAMALGRKKSQGRYWLAHSTILDERVQDDPDAPSRLRMEAKRNEQLARAALAR